MYSYRITPIENSLNNEHNEHYLIANDFEDAVGKYAKLKFKNHTEIWQHRYDKPKTAYIGNSFCIIEKETRINKYFALL